MRKFKRLNIIKETDSDLVADRLLEAGFEEIMDDNEPEGLSRDNIKAQLDAAGIEYAKNTKTEILLEILEASKLGE
nr:MAG TPA: dimeris T4 recombination endonuclease VII [Caudoviricetes sp.]